MMKTNRTKEEIVAKAKEIAANRENFMSDDEDIEGSWYDYFDDWKAHSTFSEFLSWLFEEEIKI